MHHEFHSSLLFLLNLTLIEIVAYIPTSIIIAILINGKSKEQKNTALFWGIPLLLLCKFL